MKPYLYPHSISYPVNWPLHLLRSLLLLLGLLYAFFVSAQSEGRNKQNHFPGYQIRKTTGGNSEVLSGAGNPVNALWFNATAAQGSAEFNLPLVLTSFSATISSNNVNVSWVTGMEKSLSHFVIQRSTNGTDYSDAGIVLAAGNSGVRVEYDYTDLINKNSKGVIYYRLKMVDVENRYQYSQVRLIRVGESKGEVKLYTYPNPVASQLRVTIPGAWQNKTVNYDLYDSNGRIVRHQVNSSAGQTEIIDVQDIPVGLYIVKVSKDAECVVQRIVKSN